jgi:hypothetical protein
MLTAIAHAQKASGSIEGTITDPAGAVVPKARITATSENTGEKLVTLSSQSGFYRVLELHPDSYSMIVETQGFKRITEEHVLDDPGL